MRIRCFHKVIVTSLLVLIAQLAQSTPDTEVKRTIRLTSFHIPLMVETDKRGLFIDLVRRIEQDTNLKFQIEVWPAPRAIQYFEEKKYDVLFPGLDSLFDNLNAVYPSRELLYVKYDYVFTLNQHRKIRNIDQLSGLSVGLTRSYPYAHALINNKNLEFIYVTSDEQNAHMLARKRIDAFVVEESSGIEAFIKTGLIDKVHYPEDSPISKQNVYFTFHNNADGQALERLFSNALAKLKANGEFKKIMTSALRTGLEPQAKQPSPP